ncbi:lysophospholipid acyltransferase family protein [Roseateles sp. SL47]|jgi:1-acyl-sn-glycerol-3-phosphate acyltransferase|uniref:lysophospholipid acyltransferase family protein n=1 Tax=Roseateles sp. SL47 TaxID=2995138 RepID=UPI00226F5D1A|nr:lysophospholipid acyltransferase family protein [Roseateles sp. SL47]WAC74658.1 lysophospholipid acyltransferase family protein [Roseateles sp. SL47]
MLVALRSLLFVLWLTVTVIPWGTAVVLVSPFLSSTRLYWMCAGWLTVAMWGARVICGVRWKVRGMENLPTGPQESVILLSKHQSTWETFAYPMLMPRPLAYVFKRELIYVPFFGWAMARLDMIHIDRSKRSQAWAKVAAQGKRLAAQGTWVIMFPEGTRIPRGEAGDYKTGGTRLACETGQPVVPIAVNAARCWPRKSFLLRPGVVDISVGPQIPSTGRAPAELMREVQGWIEAEMHRIDPEAYPTSAPAPVAAPPASASA